MGLSVCLRPGGTSRVGRVITRPKILAYCSKERSFMLDSTDTKTHACPQPTFRVRMRGYWFTRLAHAHCGLSSAEILRFALDLQVSKAQRLHNMYNMICSLCIRLAARARCQWHRLPILERLPKGHFIRNPLLLFQRGSSFGNSKIKLKSCKAE